MSGRLGDGVRVSVGVWRRDDGRGGEYVIHLDDLLTESAWVSVSVYE